MCKCRCAKSIVFVISLRIGPSGFVCADGSARRSQSCSGMQQHWDTLPGTRRTLASSAHSGMHTDTHTTVVLVARARCTMTSFALTRDAARAGGIRGAEAPFASSGQFAQAKQSVALTTVLFCPQGKLRMCKRAGKRRHKICRGDSFTPAQLDVNATRDPSGENKRGCGQSSETSKAGM